MEEQSPFGYNASMHQRLSRIVTDMETGREYSFNESGKGAPGLPAEVPPLLTPLLHETVSEPIVTQRIPIRFAPEFTPPSEFAAEGETESGILLDNRFLVIGTEQTEVVFYITADITDDQIPVQTIDFDFDPVEGPQPGTLPPVTVLEPVAPSLLSFLTCMKEIEEHMSVPLLRTPVRSEHENRLKTALEKHLGKSIAGTWWVGRLSQGQHDHFWNQFHRTDRDTAYKESVRENTEYNEAVFGLFSLFKQKKITCIRYFGIIEDRQTLPLLIDLLACEEDTEIRNEIIASITNLRSESVSCLEYAAAEYPVAEGRIGACDCLAELDHPEAADMRNRIPEKRDTSKERQDPPAVYRITLPPFDIHHLSRIRHMSFLLILFAALLCAGGFYIVTHNILSMVLGAGAVVTASVFLPDLSSFLLARKLASAGYRERLIDIPRIRSELEAGNIARCIEYAAENSAFSIGYLFYLLSELEQGEERPYIFFCRPEDHEETVSRWYEEGLILYDGLRSKEIREFWEGFHKVISKQ